MSQRAFNKRQMAMHAKLRRLDFVPVVWQRKDGKVWIEEQHPGKNPFEVRTSYGEPIRASVENVGEAIDEALKSDKEFKVEEAAMRPRREAVGK